MRITLTLKPKVMTADTKQDLLRKISGSSIWNRNYDDSFREQSTGSVKGLIKGRANGTKFDGTVRMYNLQKLRRKTKTTTKLVTRGKDKGTVKKTLDVIRRGHWVAYVYDIPYNMVNSAKQYDRNFTLVMKTLL